MINTTYELYYKFLGCLYEKKEKKLSFAEKAEKMDKNKKAV